MWLVCVLYTCIYLDWLQKSEQHVQVSHCGVYYDLSTPFKCCIFMISKTRAARVMYYSGSVRIEKEGNLWLKFYFRYFFVKRLEKPSNILKIYHIINFFPDFNPNLYAG